MSKISAFVGAAVLATAPMITAPVQAAEASVYIFAPTSNVRDYPNGPVQCKITTKQHIVVYTDSNQGGWYETYFCGLKGWIHHSQFAWN